MKKNLLLSLAVMILMSGSAFADNFDNLDGITSAQKQQLSRIHFKYKQENNALEQRIIENNSKLLQLQNDTSKSPSEAAMLKSSYEKNIKTLKDQQADLEKITDESYKSILTEAQFQQYKAQKVQTENAFSNFLQK